MYSDRRNRLLGVEEDRRRQVLAAVDLVGLGDQQLVPVLAGGLELLVGDHLVEVGAGEVKAHAVAVGHHGELKGLLVDAEPMTPELDDAGALFEDVLAVAQGPRRVLLRRFEPRVELLGLDAVADLAQLGRDLPHFGDHRVADEVGVELVARLQALGAAHDPLEDALGRLHHPLGPALTRVDQALLLGAECLVDVLALGGELLDELIELAEAALQLLDLEHQLGKLLVAFLRRVGQTQGAAHRLSEELELGPELGDALGREQLLAPRFEDRAGAVEAAQDLGDAFENPGADGGVVDLEAADDLGQKLHAIEAVLGVVLDLDSGPPPTVSTDLQLAFLGL